jgi:GGDEF domain-containing protein
MTSSTLEGEALLAVFAILAALLMFGLGFLYRPTWSTLLWSMVFFLVTLGTFGVIVADATTLDWIDDIAVGLMLGAPALVWSGLRAERAAPARSWIAVAQGVASAGVLLATAGLPVHSLAYSVAYLGSTVMAALSAVELLRRPERGGGMLLPLTVVSLVLPLIGVASVSAALLADGGTQHTALPDVKVVGQVVYLTCALISLLFLTRFADSVAEVKGQTEFAHIADDRLARAATAEDRNWAMLSLSLDDTGPLRVAVGEPGLQRIMARFAADVRASFPVEADIGPDSPYGFLVLLSRPDGVVRESIRDLLERIGTVTPDQPIETELSASVGWAPVRTVGYDAVQLIDAAHAAMARAREAGGNRWERVE